MFGHGKEVQTMETYIDPISGVERGLKNRHLSMMALPGPGLLVGSGGALESGGPASLIIGFGVIGVIAFSIMQSLGDITTLYPGGGSFISLADRMVDKAVSVAVAGTTCYTFIIWPAVLANEYNVISGIFVFWSDKVPVWGYFLIFWFAFLGFQLIGVEVFGEAEFWLALAKLLGLTAYFIFAIVYASGRLVGQTSSIGFQDWHNPGAFNGHGFRGVATVFVFSSKFYAGCESVAVAATETRNPGVAVPQAIRQVFWRIIFVYMGSAFFFGLTCPANASDVVKGSSRALQSPMIVAIQTAGCSIYIGSRTVLYMARSGKAPKFLCKTNKRGVPVSAILLTNLFGALSQMNNSTGASAAYSYIVKFSGVSTFLDLSASSISAFAPRGICKVE